jgi:hypothetical protein
MYDAALIAEKLKTIREAPARIARRFADIEQPEDFTSSDAGIDRMGAICMISIFFNFQVRKNRMSQKFWRTRAKALHTRAPFFRHPHRDETPRLWCLPETHPGGTHHQE